MIKKHYIRELKWNYGNRNLYGIVQYSLSKKIKSFKYPVVILCFKWLFDTTSAIVLKSILFSVIYFS